MNNHPAMPDDLTDDLEPELNACSTYDCTGLIPALATEQSEIEAYEDIYPYLSPDVKPDKNIKDFNETENNG